MFSFRMNVNAGQLVTEDWFITVIVGKRYEAMRAALTYPIYFYKECVNVIAFYYKLVTWVWECQPSGGHAHPGIMIDLLTTGINPLGEIAVLASQPFFATSSVFPGLCSQISRIFSPQSWQPYVTLQYT